MRLVPSIKDAGILADCNMTTIVLELFKSEPEDRYPKRREDAVCSHSNF